MNAYTMPSFQRGRGGEETAEQIKAFPTTRFLKNSYISNHFVWDKEKKSFSWQIQPKLCLKKLQIYHVNLNKLGEMWDCQQSCLAVENIPSE